MKGIVCLAAADFFVICLKVKNDETSKTHPTIDSGNYSLVSLLDCWTSGILPAIFDNIHGHI